MGNRHWITFVSNSNIFRLSQLIYLIFCQIYPLFIRVVAPFHPKARAWIQGRRGIFEKLAPLQGGGPYVWMHCASLGEFEQGRPVLEAIRKNYPGHKILLTFFSPSGFEIQQHYKGADFVFYLPMDGPRNAKRFIEIVDPKLVIFVKYEFWFYYLKKLFYRNIPLLLIAAYFRPNMSFFHWYGALPRKMLTRFDQIFVQDEDSLNLLMKIGIKDNVRVGGDTRFDRVVAIAKSKRPVETIDRLLSEKPNIIVGSSWPADEQLWASVRQWTQSKGIMIVLVPHEVTDSHIKQLQFLFPEAILYSNLTHTSILNTDVLIIDEVGILSQLYRYGWVNYVGGGMTSGGVHNVLEAAVYGRPVLTGPFIEKYREAVGLAAAKGSYTLAVKNSSKELEEILSQWWGDASKANEVGQNAARYVQERTRSVDRIMHHIQEKRLLINASN